MRAEYQFEYCVMLNALEEDPDEKGRWKRLATGAAIAAAATGVVVYVANTYAPARELMQRVVQMTFQAPPPIDEDKPLPPLPPPPPPKPQPKKQETKPQKKEAAPKPDANPSPANPAEVGMDSQSFAEGGGGPGFRVGGNQMGDPNSAGPITPPKPAPLSKATVPRSTKYLMAKPLGKGANVKNLFNKRARKLGLSGLMLIELDLDAKGRVKTAKVRKGIESTFDREVLASVQAWMFEPPGKVGADEAVASVRLLRLRFDLATGS
jgi:periplasmic protein TonB